MIEEYAKYLDGDFSVDYWSDEGIGVAVSILSRFKGSDWTQLEHSLGGRSDQWLTRCAETLSEANQVQALQLLLRLIESNGGIVRIAALDAMSSLVSQGLDVRDSVDEILVAIEKTRPNADSVDRIALDALEDRLRTL